MCDRLHEVVAFALSPQASVAVRLDTQRLLLEALPDERLRAAYLRRYVGRDDTATIAVQMRSTCRGVQLLLAEAREAVEWRREDFEEVWGARVEGGATSPYEIRRSAECEEESREIPGYAGHYRMTKDGRVWSTKSGAWMGERRQEGASPFYCLWSRGKRHRIATHKLYALTWGELEERPLISDRELSEYLTWRYGATLDSLRGENGQDQE